MVSVLVLGLSGMGSSSGWEQCVGYWARHLNLTVLPSTQMYKWVQPFQ